MQITREVASQYPAVVSLCIARGAEVAADSLGKTDGVVVLATTSGRLDGGQRTRLADWMKIRLGTDNLKLYELDEKTGNLTKTN